MRSKESLNYLRKLLQYDKESALDMLRLMDPDKGKNIAYEYAEFMYLDEIRMANEWLERLEVMEYELL